MDRYEHSQHEVNGRQYIAYTAYDDSGQAPWDDDCTLDGVVSDWKHTGHYGNPRKAPFERGVLCTDRNSYRTFDNRRYMALAKEHGCTRERAHKQCLEAFERMRQWCSDQWQYIGVMVECVDYDGNVLGEDALWGIESDCEEYIKEVIQDCIEGIGYSLDRERTERSHWETRGTVTEGARA
jgi:hypothetical protein